MITVITYCIVLYCIVFINIELFLQVRIIKAKMNEKLIMTTLTIVLFTLGYCHAEESQQYRQNPCVLKQTCHECIQTPTCAWCAQPVRKKNL